VPLRLISGHYWNTIPPSIWSLRYTFEIILNWFCEKITKTLRGFGLDRLKAETLELRHLKCDLTVMFSIIRGFLEFDCNSLFHVIDREPVRTHGHNLRLYKEHCNVNSRLNAFVFRNINVWNRLPAHVVNTAAVFKRRRACVNI